jgi:hypothetical protein
MTTRQLRKRVERVEQKACRQHDRTYTLEELCRLMWRQSKKEYLEMANGEQYFLRSFIPLFEGKDAKG